MTTVKKSCYSSLVVLLTTCVSPLAGQPDGGAKEERFRLIGNGAMALQAGEDVQSGAFGGMVEYSRVEVTFIATVSSSSAVTRGRNGEDFATSIRPIRAGATGAFFDARLRPIKFIVLRGYFNYGNVDWVLEETNPNGATVETSEDGSVSAAGATLFVDLLGGREVVENRMSLQVGGGWTWRMLGGSLRTNEEFLMRTIGTTKADFAGPEIVGILRINDAEVALHVPFFGNKSVPDHLRGGEAFGAVNITAGINIPLGAK